MDVRRIGEVLAQAGVRLDRSAWVASIALALDAAAADDRPIAAPPNPLTPPNDRWKSSIS